VEQIAGPWCEGAQPSPGLLIKKEPETHLLFYSVHNTRIEHAAKTVTLWCTDKRSIYLKPLSRIAQSLQNTFKDAGFLQNQGLRGRQVRERMQESYVFLTVHLLMIHGKWPTWRTIIFYVFISILCMFRATQCSSSGESIVPIQHLVYFTMCRWPFRVQVGTFRPEHETFTDT